MISQTQQEWFDAQKARFAEPGTERLERDGRVFIRNLGKRCPWCRDKFFAYQVEGQEHEPYRIDDDPDLGNGMRETCGHPKCLDAEDLRQFERRRDFRKQLYEARERAQAGPPPPAKGRKV